MPYTKGITRQQKEAIGLLSAGTFLEYFDLMLYVHMAVFLNELFFPKTDPLTTQLITAFTFSSSYLLRPIGGLFIGWIGDRWGRKSTIMITMSIMACSCLTMANIGTYAEIGITASIVMITCRLLQGFSSLGEVIGTQIYMVEIFRPPNRYVYNEVIAIAVRSGGLLSLCVASFAVSAALNWRLAFWFGTAIALVGIAARTRLRETSEFVNYKIRIAKKLEKNNQNPSISGNIHISERVDKKAVLAYFLLDLVCPLGMYTTYIYPQKFMKEILGFSSEQVISQNLKVTFFTVLGAILIALLVRKHHPLKVAQVTLAFFVILLPFIPYCLNIISSAFPLFLLQLAFFSLALNTSGTLGTALFKHFPITKRFRITGLTFGIASPLSTLVVSFSLIPLTNCFGHYGLWGLFIPTTIGYYWGINYLKKLETEKGSYLNYPQEVGNGLSDTILEDRRYDDEDYLGDEYEPFKGRCEFSTSLLNKIEELNKTMNRKVNINAVKHGIVFAKRWHGNDMRKTGTEPFYSHPIVVAKLASAYYFKTDVIIACLLHDTVEDTGCTLELIEEKFNARIAQMVNGLTKYQTIDGKEGKLTLKETLERLHKMEDFEALFIKGMDRVHNLQTIDGLKPEKRKKMVEETIKYMLPGVAYVCEKLGIHKKIHLENKLFKPCYDILSKENSQ